MNGEEPPSKQRRMDFLMLPDDLVLSCLARVSRLYYPILSLVSKKFRNLLASTELYQTRTLLDRTESCLYVCLRQSTYSGSKTLGWFTLCRRPNSSKKILVPISYPNYELWTNSAVVVGPNIYAIGGFVNDYNISSRVMVMNCRTHTWREAPRMQVARKFQYSTCVLDGKIYVTGGLENFDAIMKWTEVFDTKTQTWEFMHTPYNEEICRSFQYESVGYEETVYVRDRFNHVTYKLHKGRWIKADLEMNSGWGSSSSFCVIENVFYCCKRSYGGTIEWYDSRKRLWTTLKGLERLLRLTGIVKLADYGGKMVVLWEGYGYVKKHRKITIWCAEIAIEKRQNGEIWGMLEWFEAVYTNTNNVRELDLTHAVVTTI